MGIGLAVRTSESSIGIQVERGLQVDGNLPRPIAPSLEWLAGRSRPIALTELLQRPANRIRLFGTPRRLGRSLEVIQESWVARNLVRIVRYAPDCVGILAPTAHSSVTLQRAESILGVPRYSSMVIAGLRDLDLVEKWPQSCTWAEAPAAIADRVSFLMPQDPPAELAGVLVRAMKRVQPSSRPD